jgi:hypothetical protein
MKFTVRIVGGASHEIDIKNPKATVANLRAAVAVKFKLSAADFRLTHGGITGLDGSDAQKLSELALAEGDTVTVVMKRAREEARQQAAPSAGSQRLAQLLAEQQNPMGDFEAMSGDEDFDEEASDDDDEDDFNMEDEELEIDDDELDDSPEGAEQNELATTLMRVDGEDTLHRRFLADPRAVMTGLQRDEPRLFTLIGKHPQFFLDMLSAHEEWDDDEEIGGGDDDDDSDASGSELAGSDAAEIAEALGEGAPRRARAAAPAAVRRDAPLTAEDTANIESLMELGFARAVATEAYHRCSRKMERAAALLFDSPPDVPSA